MSCSWSFIESKVEGLRSKDKGLREASLKGGVVNIYYFFSCFSQCMVAIGSVALNT